ncbi:MAG: hypothetical protein M3157_06230 [Actinomycetota bacterium]|nr:hypothetical protein [Actinomycetota bacterium]
MSQESISARDFDPTLATLREGVLEVALDRAREEVDTWERRLRESDDRNLVPVADNLARLRTELEREPLDGVTISGLMTTLAGQVREVASEGAEGAGPGPVAGKLEDLAKLLEVEGRSLSEPRNEG